MSETADWKAAVSGNFADAADWSTGTVPGTLGPSKEDNADTALLDATGAAYSVVFNSSNGEIDNVAQMSIAANATFYVIGSKGMESILATNVTENDGKIVIGVKAGGSGAYIVQYGSGAQVNNGLIVVKADGTLVENNLDNNGVIDIAGGTVDDFSTNLGTGKFRIDGGHLVWNNTYLGPVSFYGTGGGEFELVGENADGRVANISGFSNTGNTSVVIDNWTKGTDYIRVKQTAAATELVLSKHQWLRFTGDFIGDTFSVVQQGSGLLITCQQGSGASSAASTSAVLANFTQAVAQNNNLTIAGRQGSGASSDASSRAVLARFIQFVAAGFGDPAPMAASHSLVPAESSPLLIAASHG
jgi:hypothetical protein